MEGMREKMKLEAEAIEKWYFRGKGESNRFFAVEKTDFTAQSGCVAVLTGRSGSGKTTLLNMLSGILTPDSGRVLLDGRDLYAMSDDELSGLRNRCFGMIPQGADLLPALTVMENILLPGGIYAGRRDPSLPGIRERAGVLLERLEISSLADVPAGELSGGERRRACVVRALAGMPGVIFADEPTSDLDDENMRLILELLREAADEGAAVIMVTHDREALAYADVRLEMSGGVLYESGGAV